MTVQKTGITWLIITLSMWLGIDSFLVKSFGASPLGQSYELIFEHDFKTNSFLKDGRIFRANGALKIDVSAGEITFPSVWTWVRPVSAGYTARLTVDLEFPPLINNGDASECILGFVLSNRHCRRIRIYRTRRDSTIISRVQFLDVVEDKNIPEGKNNILREFTQSEDLPNGLWSLVYQHGLVLVEQEGKEVWRGYMKAGITVVIGVTWHQIQGNMTCRGMRFEAVLPPKYSDEEQAKLRKAAEFNNKGLQLYREDKNAEALVFIKQASDLYLQILGEEHHDSANSFTNVATLLERNKQFEQAQKFYERALRIRKKLLGSKHPDVALVLTNLGDMMMTQKKFQQAGQYYLECLPILEQTFGKESSKTRSISGKVDKLRLSQSLRQ
jgi:Tfp pilus assembly protein PilF